MSGSPVRVPGFDVETPMEKREELYAGKAKSVYRTDDPERFVLLFRDDTSAFDGEKKEQLNRKGMVNNKFNAFIMEKLQAAGVPTHFEGLLSDTESLVRKLDMIPVECVVRNVSAGSLCRRLGVAEGQTLNPPTFELFLKNDALHDPMVNESLAISFGWATETELVKMKELTYKVNEVLKALFEAAGMILVDYKLEFGRSQGEIVLGDEFSPDGCRIWDRETRKKMDKDRFRQGLGDVIEAYEEVGRRLGIDFG
jgi:phosphoribosylaminoimidazole-succinocarboxamide synthase